MTEQKAILLRRELVKNFPWQKFTISPGDDDNPWEVEFHTNVWYYSITFEEPYIRLRAVEIHGKNSVGYTCMEPEQMVGLLKFQLLNETS